MPGSAASLDDGKKHAATGFSQLAVSVILLSSAWPLTKIALSLGSTPIWFAEGRAVLSGATIAVILALRGRLRVPHRDDLPALVAVGVCQLGLYFAFAHEAVAWVAAGRTAILANTTTIWVVPLSLIFLREHIPLRRWLAAGFGLAGVVVLMSPWAIDWSSRDVLIGHAFLLGASLSWSVAIIVTRAATPRSTMFELLPWCFAVSAVLLAPLVLWHAPHGGIGTQPMSWVALAYIGLIAGPFGTWCVIEATATLPAVVSSVGFLTTPAISLILANLMLGEPITAGSAGGIRADHRRRRLCRMAGTAMMLHAIEAGQGDPPLRAAARPVRFGAEFRPRCSARSHSIGGRLRSICAITVRARTMRDMRYATMAADVLQTLERLSALPATLLGHSMGGKAAMQAALMQPDAVARLIVADIAPVPNPPHLRAIAAAMASLPLVPGMTRAQADAALADAVPDAGMRAFLLQNLQTGATPAWRIGLSEIIAEFADIEAWDAPLDARYAGPTLFIAGATSNYIKPEHRPVIRSLFPRARFVTLKNAGHWLHADNPAGFVAVVEAFLTAAG